MKNKIIKILLLLGVVEFFSLLGVFFPWVSALGFCLTLAATLYFCLRDLEYGLYIIVGELLVGSFGYLFSVHHSGAPVSLRIGIFAVFMLVYFFRFWQGLLQGESFLIRRSKYRNWYLGLGLACLIGVITGYYKHYPHNLMFLDANAWLFFLLLIPFYDIIYAKNHEQLEVLGKNLSAVVIAGLLASFLKVGLSLYIFSHSSIEILYPFYKWIRDTRVGEITLTPYGFYRIFFQSQIYSLLLLFPLLTRGLWGNALSSGARISTNRANSTNSINLTGIKKSNGSILFLSGLVLANLVISFSRSFWVGGAVGLIFILAILLFLSFNGWSLTKFVKATFKIVPVILLSVFVIGLLTQFPFPPVQNNYSLLEMLRGRLHSDSAVSSRWQLVAPLWHQISKPYPQIEGLVFGRGFGTTVTYQSQDPRVLAQNKDGWTTTSAFEWGWLDIWLKIGLFGVLIYVGLLFKLIKDYLTLGINTKTHIAKPVYIGFAASVVALAALHIFTPYLNHPLGISYIVLLTCLADALNARNLNDSHARNLHGPTSRVSQRKTS